MTYYKHYSLFLYLDDNGSALKSYFEPLPKQINYFMAPILQQSKKHQIKVSIFIGGIIYSVLVVVSKVCARLSWLGFVAS